MKTSRWTKAELDTLRALWDLNLPRAELAAKVGRTFWACRTKARNEGLSLRCPPPQIWRDDEIATLKAMYATHTLAEIGAVLGRSGPACREKGCEFGLRRPKGPSPVWSPELSAALDVLLAAGATHRAAAKVLGVTNNAISGHRLRERENAKRERARNSPPATITTWGRIVDRSTGFPMPLLRL